MKRRRVLWARSALDELKQVVGFIAVDSPAAATRVASVIRRAGDNLGRAATGRPGRLPGAYEKVLAPLPYLVIYQVEAGHRLQEEVVILHVVHGARKWPPEDEVP